MISRDQFGREFAELALRAGITRVCRIDFADYMRARNEQDPRAFAEVEPESLSFYFAPQILDLSHEHRRGLIAHEIGHVLCVGLPNGGTEADADRAAFRALGIRVEYDCRWPGKGLQRAVNPAPVANPPNRYGAKCSSCGEYVRAGEGTLSGTRGAWKTHCSECVAPAPKQKVIIKATLRGHNVEFRLQSWAGDSFYLYKEACSPCKLKEIDGEKVNRIALTNAGPVLEAMQSLPGFILDADPKIFDAMRGRAGDITARKQKARERLEDVDAMLAQRGQSLYPYQHRGVEWLATQDSAILADDMGLGKTVQALVAAPTGAPILVVSPAVAKGVWVREVGIWRPDLKTACLSGRKSFRWPEPGEMVVTNYDILSDTVGPAPDGVVVIADEAHKVKNNKSKQTKRFRIIADRARDAGGMVWLLTATPILGKPPELWSLLQAIDKVPFSDFDEFAEMMGGEQDKKYNVWQYGVNDVDPEVAERLRPLMLRRMKTEVLTDLPPKQHKDVSVDLPKTLEKQLTKVLKKWDTLGNPNKLPPFEYLSGARADLAGAKIGAMLATVEEYEEAEEPLVVFSAHRAPVDTLQDRPGWAVITGDTKPSERTEIENAFQRGQLKGIAGTIPAMGTALTLTHASNALFVDLDWTPALNSQAEDRIYRIGQDRGVLITRLVADHALDQRLAEILSAKQELISETVDAARRGGDEEVDPDEAERLDRLADALAEGADEVAAELEDYLEQQAAYMEELSAMDARARQKAEERIEREWQNEVRSRIKSRRMEIQVMDDEDETLRGPITNVEEWTQRGLENLTAMDMDFAKYENAAGFNKADSRIGHALARRAKLAGLSDIEWQFATAMLAKYWRQIGQMPKLLAAKSAPSTPSGQLTLFNPARGPRHYAD